MSHECPNCAREKTRVAPPAPWCMTSIMFIQTGCVRMTHPMGPGGAGGELSSSGNWATQGNLVGSANGIGKKPLLMKADAKMLRKLPKLLLMLTMLPLPVAHCLHTMRSVVTPIPEKAPHMDVLEQTDVPLATGRCQCHWCHRSPSDLTDAGGALGGLHRYLSDAY